MLATLAATPFLGAFLDGTLPENAKGTAFGWIFPLLALVLLGGSVWLILTTDIGAKRAIQLCSVAFLTYLFFHCLSWIFSGNGKKVNPEGATYWDTRLWSYGIAAVAAILVATLLFVWHRNERMTQRVDDDD